jgi:hypothetical protein
VWFIFSVDRHQKLFAVQIFVHLHAPRFDIGHALLAVPFYRLRVQQDPIAIVVAYLNVNISTEWKQYGMVSK